jgi:outer membrane protein assembly factor BamE (lipoprotein component of BamABCDE complex)
VRKLPIILLVLSAALTSCSTHKIHPKFSTTPKVVSLRGGDSKADVERKLGCPPYDLYVVQQDGFSIYQWYYKREVRELSRKKLLLPENHKNGDPRLEKKLSQAFVIFDKADQLYSIITKSGRGDLLSLAIFNNDVSVVDKNRIDIWFDPTSGKAISADGVALSYQDIIRIIDEFFDGNSDINLDEIYEMIDSFFDQ